MKNDTKLIFSGLFLILLLAVSVSAYDVCIDKTAPTAPTNLVIADSPYDADGIVTLSWGAATDKPDCSGIAYYNIYRSNSSSSSGFVNINKTSMLSYTDSGLVQGMTYYYKVTAVDKVEFNPHEGPSSNVASTTIGTAPSGGGSTGGTGGSSGGSGGSSGGSGGSYSAPAQTTNTTNTTGSNATAQPAGQTEGNLTSESLAGSEGNATLPSNSTGRRNLLTGLAIGDLFGKGNPLIGILIIILIVGFGLWLFFFLKRRRKKKRK